MSSEIINRYLDDHPPEAQQDVRIGRVQMFRLELPLAYRKLQLSLIAILCMLAPAHAQETRASLPEPKPAQSPDRATELMRREVEAMIAEREKLFARLKELAPAPVPAPAPVGAWSEPVMMLERLPTLGDYDEADVIAPPQPKFVVAEQTFDRYIFGGTGGLDWSRDFLESILTGRIQAIDRQRRLTPDQKTKLVLAGRGDIKRLFDQIEDERKQFELLRTDRRGCQRFLRELQPLWRTMRQAFDDGSLFAKTLKKMVEEDAAVARTPM